MTLVLATFGDTSGSAFGALGLNVQSFVFQLVTFLLLLLILRKYAYPPIVKTLDERRKAVEQSIDQAREAAAALEKAEAQIAGMLREARGQAEELVTAGHREAAKMVEEAEAKAAKRAERIVAEAKADMGRELAKASEALKHETAQLVADAAGIIIQEKLDATKNAALVGKALDTVAKAEGKSNHA